MTTKKVFVSGCFDLLHSGHVEFFQRAAAYGDLNVALGSDQTVFELKGRPPVNSEEERRFMVGSVACVHQAVVSQRLRLSRFRTGTAQSCARTVFVVNEDGNTPDKRKLCEALGIEYVVLHRDAARRICTPARPPPCARSSSMPYRIDLAGGWLDQPFVSQHHPGRRDHALRRADGRVQRTQRHGHQHPPHCHRPVGQSACPSTIRTSWRGCSSAATIRRARLGLRLPGRHRPRLSRVGESDLCRRLLATAH